MDDQQKKILDTVKTFYYSEVPVEGSENKAMQIPFASLAALGGGFAAMLEPFRTVTQTATIGYKTMKPIFNTAGELRMAKNGTGYLGTIWNGNKIVGQARFVEVSESQKVVTQAVSAVNPTSLLVAAAIVVVEHELSTIKNALDDIKDYLHIQEYAKRKTNLNVLLEIINDYKFKCENEVFVNGRYKQALDIRTRASDDLETRYAEIEKLLGKKQMIHTTQSVDKSIHVIEEHLNAFRADLYVFAMSYFIEMMLSKDYQEGSLSNAAFNIQLQAQKYISSFEKCKKWIKEQNKTSVDVYAEKSAALIAKKVGKTIQNTKLGDKIEIDDRLIEAGEQISDLRLEKNHEQLENFSKFEDPGIQMYIDNINLLNKMFNSKTVVLVDDENVYLAFDEIVAEV